MELLDKLIALGEPQSETKIGATWHYFDELGLTVADGEGLIAIATDQSLSENYGSWAARIHAWRALGYLQYQPALKPLLPLFIENWDWIWEELPYVYKSFGTGAIPVLSEAIQDQSAHDEIRSLAAVSLELIGQESDEAREKAIAALSGGLSTYKRNTRELNGNIVIALVGLKAVEAFDLLKAAHEADRVNTFHCGPGLRF